MSTTVLYMVYELGNFRRTFLYPHIVLDQQREQKRHGFISISIWQGQPRIDVNHFSFPRAALMLSRNYGMRQRMASTLRDKSAPSEADSPTRSRRTLALQFLNKARAISGRLHVPDFSHVAHHCFDTMFA